MVPIVAMSRPARATLYPHLATKPTTIAARMMIATVVMMIVMIVPRGGDMALAVTKTMITAVVKGIAIKTRIVVVAIAVIMHVTITAATMIAAATLTITATATGAMWITAIGIVMSDHAILAHPEVSVKLVVRRMNEKIMRITGKDHLSA
jgi:hypothetical protein